MSLVTDVAAVCIAQGRKALRLVVFAIESYTDKHEDNA